MPLGTYTNGTGTITTSTGNNVVTGFGTTFLTQLKVGAVIGNVSNVYVGYVSNIISNTSLTLSTNANLTLSTQSFQYRPMTANTFTWTYTTTGNITANIYSATVVGNSTHFATQVNYGDAIYIANAGIANTYVGTVGYIESDTILYFTANSLANVSNLQYFNTTPTVNFFAQGQGQAYNQPNTVAGISAFNAQLYRWAQSGLIPNVSIINNYHPPIRDSATGILVNLPASVYKKTGNSVANNYTLGSSISYDGTDYVVHDFDVNQRVFGTDASYVLDSLHNSSEIKDVVLNGTTQSYNAAINQLIPQTSADHAAQFIGASVARVTDNQTLATAYFTKDTPLDTIKQYPENLTSNQDPNLRKEAKGLRKLVPTGAPIAIPGLLNAVADVYIPGNVAWTPPSFSITNVK